MRKFKYIPATVAPGVGRRVGGDKNVVSIESNLFSNHAKHPGYPSKQAPLRRWALHHMPVQRSALHMPSGGLRCMLELLRTPVLLLHMWQVACMMLQRK